MKKRWSGISLIFTEICLVFSMSCSPVLAVADSKNGEPDADAPKITAPAVVKSKEEVVYANLAADGKSSDLWVVNQFEVQKAGTLTDYGRYNTFVNLTNTEEIFENGDAVCVFAEEGSFYYEGESENKQLPWNFSIFYTLDDVKMTAEEIAGKSGALQIHITSQKNSGVNSAFYDHYMLQLTVALDGERSSDIVSAGATIANAGKNKMIVHTVMPKNDADILISATVEDFSMGSIEITAMPFSMPIEIPDMGEFTEEMETFADSMVTFKNGVEDVADGSGEFLSGIETLSKNSGALVDGSAAINGVLMQLSASLGDGGVPDLSSFGQLPAGLRDIADGLTQISGGLSRYASAFGTLDAVVGNISLDDEQNINELYEAAGGAEQASLEKLIGLLTTYKAMQQSFDGYGGLGTLVDLIDGIIGRLNVIADQIEAALESSDLMAGLVQLKDGMAQLSTQYGGFHAGLSAYADGVQKSASGYVELNSGVDRLFVGAERISDAVETLPETIQREIDALLADYDTSDFDPISFTSQKNTDVDYVQFIIMTKAITLPDVEENAEIPAAGETIWDRIVSLFS